MVLLSTTFLVLARVNRNSVSRFAKVWADLLNLFRIDIWASVGQV